MVIIGAGVIGASVAYRLAEAGVAVTVLEAHRVGGGTSGSRRRGKMRRGYSCRI
jgi:glycine/D-amino acid oxidase-like deaminating enzyme